MRFFHRIKQDQRGIALIVTLSVLAIMVMMVIGFAVSMRIEQTSSRNYTYITSSRQLAESAVDEAVYLIRSGTPTNTYYVTMPGITILAGGGGTFLYSSIATTVTNLNADQTIISSNASPSYPAAPPPINVNWVTVTAGGTNIGRYAYWVDDESDKLNINAAGLGGPPDPFSSSITNADLRAVNGFSTVYSTQIREFARTNGWFSIDQLKLITGIGPNLTFTNAFYLTAFSASDDITPWSTNRVDLNTASFGQIVSTLGISCPLFTGFTATSLSAKYGAPLINQIAANIVDFRSSGDNSTTDNQTTPTYCGQKPTPLLNEILITAVYTNSPTVTNLSVTATVELINPYSTAKGNLYQVYLDNCKITDISGISGFPTITTNASATFTADINPQQCSSVVIPLVSRADVVLTNNATIQVTFPWVRLLNAGGSLVNYAQNLTNPIPSSTYITIDITNNVASKFSIGADDPRANHAMTMVNPLDSTTYPLWKPEPAAGTGSIGSPNTGSYTNINQTIDNASDTTQDFEAGATQASHSSYYVATNNFVSPGQLGFIHTGIPWRCLRMQPRKSGNSIPDWVVLDLFGVPTASLTNSAGQPIGRVNVNQTPYTADGTIAPRTVPIRALFTTNAYSIVSMVTNVVFNNSDISTLTNNIINRVYSSWSHPLTWPPNSISLVGELCEVTGLATTCNGAAVKSNREARVARIANLVTVRSSVFSIWTIGQAFDPIGNVASETKAQAIVQRVQDPVTGNVTFRTLYFRFIAE